MRLQHLSGLMIALVLAGCGGGGGSSGSTSQTTISRLNSDATVSSDGRQRQVASPCAYTQTLGTARGDGLRINRVSWIQVVQQNADNPQARLAGGKDILVRVDLLAPNGAALPSEQKLLVSDPATGSCTPLTVTGPAAVPTQQDEKSLATAWIGRIPAAQVKPGMTVSVVFNDSRGRSLAEAEALARSYQPPVAAAVVEAVRLIPITYRGRSGTVSSPSQLGTLLTRLHPVSSVNVLTAAAFAPPSLSRLPGLQSVYVESESTMRQMLSEVDQECQRRYDTGSLPRDAVKCMGIMPDNLVFQPDGAPNKQILGLAIVGGVTLVTQSVPAIDVSSVTTPTGTAHWLTVQAITAAHEYGHLLNLDHAACGSASGTDSRLYGDGRLGLGAGHDSGRNFYFSARERASDGTPRFADLMSYCSNEWSSDLGYVAAMDYRATGGTSARTASAGRVVIRPEGDAFRLSRARLVPATLRPATATLRVLSSAGLEQLPLACEDYSGVSGPGLTPCHADLGDRQPLEISLQRPTGLTPSWQGDLLRAALSPDQ